MPVEQSERVAAEACYAFREAFPDAKTETTYRRDAVEGILEVANEIDANAIVLGPRGGARTLQWLAVTVHSGCSRRRTDQLSRYGREKVHER